MGYVKGEAPGQSSLFPPSLDELVPEDHPVRVIEAFVGALNLGELGFEHAEAGVIGRPAYDPADLLKLYLYGYLNRVRSSRRLERECHRNVEVMWLLGKLAPDFKTIAEFRRRNSQAFVRVCRAFVRFCAQAGLLGGELVAIDGSKFKAASSKRGVVTSRQLAEESRKLEARIAQYLKSLDEGDREEREEPIDRQAVAAALDDLRAKKADADTAARLLDALGETQHVAGEPEARLMRTAHGQEVAYNVQSAVDAKHGLIVHHEVTNAGTDNAQLEPTAKAAQDVLGGGDLSVVADAGYSNGTQFEACEAAGITPFVPLNRAPLHAGGTYYGTTRFQYDPASDTYRCPAGKILSLKQTNPSQMCRIYAARAKDCAACALKGACTRAQRRFIQRHWHEAAFDRMQQRLAARPDIMRLRRSLAEHPFGQLKRWVLGDGPLLLRGMQGARTEMALAVLARNLKRVMNILGNRKLITSLAR
ncbi:MAG TPA: IS1182 family transposase [Burkholderiales bacterium]|jgi:transposase|nr:IS1182 family transposase [Burkholderiales bacterium]